MTKQARRDPGHSDAGDSPRIDQRWGYQLSPIDVRKLRSSKKRENASALRHTETHDPVSMKLDSDARARRTSIEPFECGRKP
jgi:hypothetical protein